MLRRRQKERCWWRYHAGFDAHDLVASGLEAVIRPKTVIAAREHINSITVEEGIIEYIGL